MTNGSIPWKPGSPEMLVLGLVACHDAEGIEPASLHGLQRRMTRRSKAWFDRFVAECLENGSLKDDAGFLFVPEAVARMIDPDTREAANRQIEAEERQPLHHRVQERDEAILALLTSNGRVALPTARIWRQLRGNSHSTLRMLQRDLVRLEKQMLILRQDDGWVPAPRLEPKHFEDRAGAVALNILLSQFRSAIPREIVESLEPILERAKRRISALPTEDPRIRWLEALRLAPGYLPEDSPLIQPEILGIIEQAILTRSRVWLRYSESSPYGLPDQWEGEVSISHYFLQMPAKPSIVCWEEGSGRAHHIQAHDIEEIRLLGERAHWPDDGEPDIFPPLMTMRFGDADTHEGLTKVVLLVGERTMRSLKRRLIGRGMEILPHEPDNRGRSRYIVTLRVALGIPTLQYLTALHDSVILSPNFARRQAHSQFHHQVKRYQESHALTEPYFTQELLEWETSENAHECGNRKS